MNVDAPTSLMWSTSSVWWMRGLVAVVLSGAVGHVNAIAWDRLRPDTKFVQLGVADGTQTLTFGAAWDSQWESEFAGGRATAYWEVSFGRWRSELGAGRSASAWVTQVGITPVLRWYPRRFDDRWFFEAAVGANVLLPVYRSQDKAFSSAFNFGDHFAVGRRFGEANRQEIALRFQHFSNAGIKHPNPGEDFLQLRYVFRF